MMETSKAKSRITISRNQKRYAVGLLGIAFVLIVATQHFLPAGSSAGSQPGTASSSIYWRAQLFLRKAEGGIPELSWRELFELTSVRGSNLGQMIDWGSSLEGSLINPFNSAQDIENGDRLFRERCSTCHGNKAEGRHGPPLVSSLKHGDSEFSVYRVIRDGVPGTIMEPVELTSRERWQIVAFLRTLRSPAPKSNSSYPSISVSGDDVRNAGSAADTWLTYSGSLNGSRYSKLSEINSANVSKLRIRWISQFNTTENTFQATPIVVGGRMFVSEPPSNVVALDAKSGATIWRFTREMPSGLPVCCARANRGLAILGSNLFLGTLDGHLLAIDANTGHVNWDTVVADPRDGYTLTGAPLIANNAVIIGEAGGDYGARGFLAAYDPENGQQRWRFQTIPEEDQLGHDTWQGDSWRRGGGATWATGSYDPELDLLYWGIGNPAPDFDGDVRKGDNLFTESVVALHASSGKLAWHFQFTPHDEHDWDSAQTPTLANAVIDGNPRKLILWFNRNGFYYVLDRVTGKFILGTPFVNQNWAKGLDAAGRPIPMVNAESNDVGRLTRPGVSGATNWQPFALDPARGLAFVQAVEGASIFTKSNADRIEQGKAGFYLGSSGGEAIFEGMFVRALDMTTGAKVWEYPSPKLDTNTSNLSDAVPKHSGLLATAGGLVFGASGGYLFAVDTKTGKECWRVYLGGETQAPPISFEIDGHQVIAVSAGRALFVFEL